MRPNGRNASSRPPSAFKRSNSKWGWALLGLALLGAGAYWLVSRQQRGQPDTAVAAGPDVAAGAADAGTLDAPPAAPLLGGEALLREWAPRLSKAPELSNWLQGEDILRRLVAAVHLVSLGESPRRMLSFLGISGPFETSSLRGRLVQSPQSEQRYQFVADVIASIDMRLAGQAYEELRPFLRSAYAEVGEKGHSFEDSLGAAIERLVRLEIPDEPPPLMPKGALYAYADPGLERLSPAEKHLLRMGASNGVKLQAQLRAFREAAGIPIVVPPATPAPVPSEDPAEEPLP